MTVKIKIEKETRNKLIRMKVKTGFYNLDEVIEVLLKNYNEVVVKPNK